MGMQLGPGFMRRPPGGWLPGRASAVAHRVFEWGSSGPDGGQSDIDTSCRLDARWRIELPGREPYEFDEEDRTAPTWVLGGAGIGAGRRWYKVRVAPTYGLTDPSYRRGCAPTRLLSIAETQVSSPHKNGDGT